jgi:hypothetical protein
MERRDEQTGARDETREEEDRKPGEPTRHARRVVERLNTVGLPISTGTIEQLEKFASEQRETPELVRTDLAFIAEHVKPGWLTTALLSIETTAHAATLETTLRECLGPKMMARIAAISIMVAATMASREDMEQRGILSELLAHISEHIRLGRCPNEPEDCPTDDPKAGAKDE